MLLFIADLARGPFHGLGLGEGDSLDGGRAVVQASAVAVAVIALGIRASADVDISVLHGWLTLITGCRPYRNAHEHQGHY